MLVLIRRQVRVFRSRGTGQSQQRVESARLGSSVGARMPLSVDCRQFTRKSLSFSKESVFTDSRIS